MVRSESPNDGPRSRQVRAVTMRGQQEVAFHGHAWAECVGRGFMPPQKEIATTLVPDLQHTRSLSGEQLKKYSVPFTS